MIIVNWNTEWAPVGSSKAKIIRDRIHAFDPEVVCLTEAYDDFSLETGYLISSDANYGYQLVPGRRKVMLWSRRPWINVIKQPSDAMPPGRYVYGETETSLGMMGIHGVCIPWADAHVRTGEKNRQRWEDHLAYLSALPSALDEQDCELQLLVGDYNQRVPRKRVPVHVYKVLENTLAGRFTILTTDIISPIEKQTIDHVAVTDQLTADWVQGISNIDPDGRKLSDHFGIAASLVRAF